MEMIDEILSDEEARSTTGGSISISHCSRQTTTSNDSSFLLKYQGSLPPSAPTSPTAIATASISNVAVHERQRSCSPSSLQLPNINNPEEDLLDEFFNTIQEYVCHQEGAKTTLEGHARRGNNATSSPQSSMMMMSCGGLQYEKDFIDVVFENVENVTCNKPSSLHEDQSPLPPHQMNNNNNLHDTLEKIQTLGKTVHLKLYRKDPETVQKRVDEWFAENFQSSGKEAATLSTTNASTTTATLSSSSTTTEIPPKDEIEVEREKSLDFMDVFFQRMEQVVCVKLPFDKMIGTTTTVDGGQPTDEPKKDALDAVFETVESVVCESNDEFSSSAYRPLQHRSERSQRSIITPSNQSSTRTASVLLLSPVAAAASIASCETDTECSRTIDDTPTSSVGIHSYSEHSSRFTYNNVLSPRSERSERTNGSCEYSYTEHSRRSAATSPSGSGHNSHTEERDNRTLLSESSSSSSSSSDDEDDSTTAFDVVRRPLFVIKEDVSATESLISDRQQKERLLRQQQESAGAGRKKPGKKSNKFRYSSAHYKFQKGSCASDTATHTAQEWLEFVKYAVEATMFRVTAAIGRMDADKLCGGRSKSNKSTTTSSHRNESAQCLPKIPIEDENSSKLSHLEKWAVALDKVQENVATENVARMCSGQIGAEERGDIDTSDSDYGSATQNSSIFGLIDRSRFASASLMNPAENTNDDDDEESFQSYGSMNFVSSMEEPRTQREPPQQRQSTAKTPSAAQKNTRGRDPEPSFQLKLDGDASFVGSLRNYASCTPREFLDHDDKSKKTHAEALRSPRSSETARTAELTTTTTAPSTTHFDDDEEHDGYVDDNISTAAHISVDNMVVCLPDRRRSDHKIQSKATTDSSTAFFDTRSVSPKISNRDASSHSSKTKDIPFHTAKVFSIFDDDEGTAFTQGNDDSYFSYPDLQRTCTDIVVYEKKPDFISLWFGKDAKYAVSPWQLVVYVAWLSVSFLVRVNGEVNSHLAERKRALEAILEDEERSHVLSQEYSRDSFDAVPSIEYQISLE